ncbi:MAG TPA: caspase family protein [Candidatus Polarisedimenticolaceae bacterium]|nr:caspase family protein [Candidatus Polarisedimenticolaceae bacterium]
MRAADRRTVRLLALAAIVGSSPWPPASHGTAPYTTRTEIADPWSAAPPSDRWPRRIDWHDPSLELHLESIERHGERTRLWLALVLKPAVEEAGTSIGPARYRTTSGRWQQTPIHGLPDGARALTLSRSDTPRRELWLEVASEVATLRITLGDDTLDLELTGEPGGLASATPSAAATAPAALAPGRPVRLETVVQLEHRPFRDGALDPGETDELEIEVRNLGSRVAEGVTVAAEASAPGVELPDAIDVPPIPPGSSTTVRLPVTADADLADGTLHLTIRTREPFGHDASPVELVIPTRAHPPAQLVLTDDFAIEGHAVPLPRDSVVTLRLRVRNVGQGSAADVRASVTPGDGVYPAGDTARLFELGSLGPGEVAELSFRCYANQHASQLELHVDLSHRENRDAPARSLLALPLAGASSVARIVRLEAAPRTATVLEPAPPPLVSEVDRFVPASRSSRPAALAVVIGVERYASAPGATFAAADARTASRYFELVLGIPAERIQLLVDEQVTLGQLHRVFGPGGWVARRMTDASELFVFFAGHGVATGSGFAPYLIPVDGDLNYVEQTGFALDRLIAWLSELGARSTTVFLDTCFSGLTREGAALFATARPLVIVPRPTHPSGLSLFSAARGTQLASAHEAEGHGLFSYVLFKGLSGAADSDGDGRIVAGELEGYVEREVARTAMELDREQDPGVFVADEAAVVVEFR